MEVKTPPIKIVVWLTNLLWLVSMRAYKQLGSATFRKATFSKTTLIINVSFAQITLEITTLPFCWVLLCCMSNFILCVMCHYADCHYAECRDACSRFVYNYRLYGLDSTVSKGFRVSIVLMETIFCHKILKSMLTNFFLRHCNHRLSWWKLSWASLVFVSKTNP